MINSQREQADVLLRVIDAAYRGDHDTAAQLLDNLVVDERSAFVALVTLADLAGRPLANERTDDADMVVIDNFGAHDLTAARLIATAANDDRATLDSLAWIVVDAGPDRFGPVLSEVLMILVAQLGKVSPESWQPRAAS